MHICISSGIFVFCIIVTSLALWLPKTNEAYLLTYLGIVPPPLVPE